MLQHGFDGLQPAANCALMIFLGTSDLIKLKGTISDNKNL